MAHVQKVNPSLNALIHFDPDFVLDQARGADRRRASGERGPWLGVPVTAKDNLWLGGRPATNGSTLFRDFVAPENAISVARLRQAGAVFLGSTNCSEFACKGVTTNLLHGTTSNPWDLDRTPGGSSGGAAAATAAGLGYIALATDAGGSTRRPAAHAGVVGMKPTSGLVPHAGGFAEPVYGHSVVGQMGRCVSDVADALALLAGPDKSDPQSPPGIGFWQEQAIAEALPPLRIAYSPRLGMDFPVDEEVSACVRRTAQNLESAGFIVKQADPEWPSEASEEALMPLQWSGLAAIYGERWRQKMWEADPDIAVQIERGLELAGWRVAAALELRKQLYAALSRFFERYDLLLTPTTPVTAWDHGLPGPSEIGGIPVSARAHAVFTPIFNHCYVPACSVPCGLDSQSLPIGIQIVGPMFADARVLALAAIVERSCALDFSCIRVPAPKAEGLRCVS
ncbi:MAG: amidase [Xanthobacteraceae bacterium]|nr:amidase [Xanthobacteraceae bacterium]